MQGETSSYSILVDRHKQNVFGLVYKIVRQKEDAEELAQDVFVRAFEKLDGFKKHAKFSSWLYRIAYNMSISSLRKTKLVVDSIDDSLIQNYSEDKIIEELEVMCPETREKHLKKAILKLAGQHQIILELYYEKEISTTEIAAIMKLTPSNVKVKLHRARQQLFHFLEPALKNNSNVLTNE
ncbi:RNA polymerase sigma factor [Flavobacteriales bacterium]|nr:RNA polymerase sigma factor [Flavobacteriales bacterium]